jgi:pilus assembly protein CpaF
MKLSDRLSGSTTTDEQAPEVTREITLDPLRHLKDRTQQALFAKLGTRLYDSSLNESELHAFVLQELGQVIQRERAPLTADERDRLAAEVRDDIIGYGPVQQFLSDASVTEIMVNGVDSIYIERAGKLHKTGSAFQSEAHLRRVIERIVGQVGRRIDESSPLVDARLPDGSRINAIIPPLSVHGPALTVRKFSKEPFQVNDLVNFGTLSKELAELLEACVQAKLNILISGGTGTGKTTLLNVLSSFIPEDERIVTIEDAVELQLRQDHVVTLESRPQNIEGKGEVTIRDLVRNALRMRPDRIVVGEVRGGEALDMLQAMNTGHEGSLSTIHANTPRDAMARLETMVLMAGMDLPLRAIRDQTASAIDLIIHLARLRDGSRRVVQLTEISGMEGDTITFQDVFTFDYEAGLDEDGRHLGTQRPTGIRPSFLDKAQHAGVQLPADIFGTPADLTRPGRTRRGR